MFYCIRFPYQPRRAPSSGKISKHPKHEPGEGALQTEAVTVSIHDQVINDRLSDLGVCGFESTTDFDSLSIAISWSLEPLRAE